MFELAIRVVFSLAVILGLLWFIARTSSRKFGGTARSAVRVVARQPLARSASLAVVEVGDRVLVVGVSEHGVNLLTEMDPDELPAPVVPETVASATQSAPVAGSVVRAARSLLARRAGAPGTVEPVAADVVQDADEAGADLAPAAGTAATQAAASEVSAPARRRPPARVTGLAAAAVTGGTSTAVLTRPQGQSALSGSVLSAQTWRQAWAAATRSNGIASD